MKEIIHKQRVISEFEYPIIQFMNVDEGVIMLHKTGLLKYKMKSGLIVKPEEGYKTLIAPSDAVEFKCLANTGDVLYIYDHKNEVIKYYSNYLDSFEGYEENDMKLEDSRLAYMVHWQTGRWNLAVKPHYFLTAFDERSYSIRTFEIIRNYEDYKVTDYLSEIKECVVKLDREKTHVAGMAFLDEGHLLLLVYEEGDTKIRVYSFGEKCEVKHFGDTILDGSPFFIYAENVGDRFYLLEQERIHLYKLEEYNMQIVRNGTIDFKGVDYKYMLADWDFEGGRHNYLVYLLSQKDISIYKFIS